MRFFFRRRKQPKLEVCTNNLDRFFTDEDICFLEALIDEKGINVREMDCLNHCYGCTRTPHALLNAKYISSESPEHLIQLIKEKLE